MNLVSLINDQAVTTSLAIAEGTGNEHKSVIQLVRTYQADLEDFGNIAFEMRNSTSGAGRPTEYAILNEQQATLLLTYMRNNEVVRAFKKRLVKAFYELMHHRPAANLPDFTNPVEAARAWADQLEQRNKVEQEKALLEQKVVEDAPKVAFHDKVTQGLDSIPMADAAKLIGTGRNRLLAFCRQIGWISRQNAPYQSKIEAGLLDVKISHWEHPGTGLQKTVTPMVTGKGLARLHQLWRERNLPRAG